MLKKSILIIYLLLSVIFISANLQESFEFGKRMYRDGFYQEAMLVFERIVNSSPLSPEGEESLFLLGEIHRTQSRYGNAEDHYRRLYERYPTSTFREKALYNWAVSLYQQKKYQQAIDRFDSFIESYPGSLDKSEAFFFLIDSNYQISAFNQTLSYGQRFMRDYPTDPKIPDVMFLMANSYLHTHRMNDAENTFNIIIRDYPQSDARWNSVITLGRIIKEERGIQPALDYFNRQVEQSMPRQFEEMILKEIADLYLAIEQYDGAAQALKTLIGKFDRSENLAEYLNLHALSYIEMRDYHPIIESFRRIDTREIAGTPYYYDYMLKVAEAFYVLNQYAHTEAIINDISDQVTEDRHIYGVLYWQARLKEHRGNLLDAIKDYQYLMSTYPVQADNTEMLMRIGDIYFEKLHMYPLAINYYNQVMTSASLISDLYWKSLYKTALCYEIMQDYNAALKSLRQINPDFIDNDRDREEVLTRIEIISQYKKIDHEKISANLIASLFEYVNTENKERLRENLILTMLLEMKDAEQVIQLLENDNSPEADYLRGRAYLKALSRAELEKRSNDRRRYLELVNRQINNMNSDSHPEYIEELEIERDYIVNGFKLPAEQLSKAENFISQYPQSSARNRFDFLIGYQYLMNETYAKADQHLSQVIKDSEIPMMQYETAIVKMGNYFFVNEQYDKVIAYFDRLETGITVNRPEELYRYSVALINTGEREQGMNSLEFLVRNTSGFPSQAAAVKKVAAYHRGLNNYNEVISFMVLFPESERGREYYLQLSEDYLQVDDKNKARESLMFITEKDNQVLFKLADLHYQTGDLIMAVYTYEGLLQNAANSQERLMARSRLGHISFIEENWRGALTHYDVVLNELGDRIDTAKHDYLDLVQIGKESTISLYRIQNRPRADTIKQRFQSILRSDQIALAEIELNEAIYQMNVNRSRAERGFSDIIRNQNLPQSIRMEAYFWRGLNHLENKKVSEAKSDFQSVLQARDRNLLNQAHLKLGTISFSQEQYQQALEHYYTVIENDITGSLAFDAAKNFAIVCKTIGEWQKAIEAYEIILDRWGEGGLEGETIFNIAYCQYRDRKYYDAIESFNKAIPLLDDREMKAEAQYWIGECYFSMGQYDSAATEYLKVGYFYSEFTHWNAISDLKLAESYVRQGRIESARNILDNIISKYGRDSDWGKQALLYLEQL